MSEKSITYNYTYAGFVVTVSRSTTESDMTRLVDFLADLKKINPAEPKIRLPYFVAIYNFWLKCG